MTKNLKSAQASTSGSINTYGISPYNSRVESYPGSNTGMYLMLHFPLTYRDEVQQCRWFYRYDPIASTTVNRMADIAITNLRHKRNGCSDKELLLFNSLRQKFEAIFDDIAVEYLISGMAIPDYGLKRIMGNRINKKLGRTRYYIPDPLWVRNTDSISIKRKPAGAGRDVYLSISDREREFIENKGKLSDGYEDIELYNQLANKFPEYIKMVLAGKKEIKLDVVPILRKPLVTVDYPQPFLVPALSALKHKLRIKQMDYSIATRATEAILHVKAGSDEFPVVSDDNTLDEIKTILESRYASAPGGFYSNEYVFKLYTNHTIELGWIYPPLDALLSDEKYVEPNADIYLALGFSRMLLVGEAERSNAGNSTSGTLGPMATINEIRTNILSWLVSVYEKVAEENGFSNYPIPYFTPFSSADVHVLLQSAATAIEKKAISRATYSELFGKDYEEELEQIKKEERYKINQNPIMDINGNNDNIDTKETNTKETDTKKPNELDNTKE